MCEMSWSEMKVLRLVVLGMHQSAASQNGHKWDSAKFYGRGWGVLLQPDAWSTVRWHVHAAMG